MTPHSPDQLRWQVTPILTLALDAAERSVVEVYGLRAIVPHTTALAESVRQLQSAQRGGHRGEDPHLFAFIAGQAAQARHDLVRQHITNAASRIFGLRVDSDRQLACDIADAAMEGMGPLFTQTVTSAADAVLSMIVNHPDWRDVIRARATGQTDAKIAGLLSFIHQVAAMRKDGEPGDDGEPYDMEMQFTVEEYNDLIARAREIDDAPDPDGQPAEPEQPLRWNNHYRLDGNWCRWSRVSAPADRAGSDDERCPFNCPGSKVEPDSKIEPTDQPQQPAISLNGTGPATPEGA